KRFGGRQVDRAGRAWDRGVDLAEETTERAGRAVDRAGEAVEGWLDRGEGDITKITFDGSHVRTSGKTSKSYPAVSGLKAKHKNAGKVDYTDPKHQWVPNKGPIPEGSYYLDPAETQHYKTAKFNPGPWGYYRTRLHGTAWTDAWRKASSERSGGFFLHKDGGNDGTAGCIGLDRQTDNTELQKAIKANTKQIPVEVSYPKASSAAPTTKSGAVQPMSRHSPLRIQMQANSDDAAAEPEDHYLITAGIAKISADASRLKKGASFPSAYYDRLARHLFKVALAKNGRDYADAFGLLYDLQGGKLGWGLQEHYTKIVGTDSANGWDKFRHFTVTAWLQYHSFGILVPEAASYGKEIYDEVEHWVGADPEGYSVPDIRADNRGEAFAEEMYTQQWAERKARARRAAARAKKAARRNLRKVRDLLPDIDDWSPF
ncbi:MAG: tlde1 domain-containing protein, partial [Pseudomonadota bacterium]